MPISGIAEARYLKLKACSEASSAMTQCRKISMEVGELCEAKDEGVGWVSEDDEVLHRA